MSALLQTSGLAKADLAAVWHLVDQNHDGSLTPAELLAAVIIIRNKVCWTRPAADHCRSLLATLAPTHPCAPTNAAGDLLTPAVRLTAGGRRDPGQDAREALSVHRCGSRRRNSLWISASARTRASSPGPGPGPSPAKGSCASCRRRGPGGSVGRVCGTGKRTGKGGGDQSVWHQRRKAVESFPGCC